ncbi:MAG TPA: nitrite/sulfite reductase [Symbiobacteriaceae bacterium]|nr:nitrite/sulfite reductase [Symbiobacteriaceae bacterium]
MSAPPKETPAQRVERVKREKAPWSILEDIKRYAREGIASIPDEDLNIRLKHWGIYTQGDGAGVRGKAVPFFLMRVRTPGGVLTADQAATIASISERYARSSLAVTVRGNFQLHWLTIEDLPAAWEEMAALGLTSMGACGDNTRTVVGCPLAGHQHDELIDVTSLALELDRFFNGHPDFANFPRKLKISITGCTHWCTYPEINDVGLTAARRGDDVGFHMRVGGGLSARPHLAVRLNAFLKPDQVLDALKAVAGIFRDSDVLRENRQKARLKFLFLDHGWTAESFLAEMERRLGYKLAPAGDEAVPEHTSRDHVGIHQQKQAGLYYAGFSVPGGRLTPAELLRLAELARTYGSGAMRLTTTQNVVLLDIPEDRLAAFRTAAADLGLPLGGSPFQRGTVSCTGIAFCKLALIETKAFSIKLAEELERRLPGYTNEVKLHVTGCPNDCGQHWIADVGLQGAAGGFDIFLGGGLGENAGFSQRVGLRLPPHEVADALERLFRFFQESREEGERFRTWVARSDQETLLTRLRG